MKFVAEVDGFMFGSSNSNVSSSNVSFDIFPFNKFKIHVNDIYFYLVCCRKIYVRNEWWISFIHEFNLGKIH